MYRVVAAFCAAILVVLTGCSSTNFAKTSTPATITEQRIKLASGAAHWGVNRLYRIGAIELGPYGPRGARVGGGTVGVTYVVDPGTTEIGAWYYDNNTGSYKANQTAVVTMTATLKPKGRYELRSTKVAEKLRFILFDVDSTSSVAESEWVDIVVKPLPEPPGTQGGASAFPGHIHIWK